MSAAAIPAAGLSISSFASAAATQLTTTVPSIPGMAGQGSSSTPSAGPTVDQDVLDRLALGQRASQQGPDDLLKALLTYKPVNKGGKVGAVHVSQAEVAMTLLLCALA